MKEADYICMQVDTLMITMVISSVTKDAFVVVRLDQGLNIVCWKEKIFPENFTSK